MNILLNKINVNILLIRPLLGLDFLKTFVAERKNFKLLFSAGVVLAVGISNLDISSNENG